MRAWEAWVQQKVTLFSRQDFGYKTLYALFPCLVSFIMYLIFMEKPRRVFEANYKLSSKRGVWLSWTLKRLLHLRWPTKTDLTSVILLLMKAPNVQASVYACACAFLYAVCARRIGRQQVKVGSAIPMKQKMERSFYTFFVYQNKLPVTTLRRLSCPVSQTGPSVVVEPTLPAQQKHVISP